ncbi:MAG: flippase activity-associated protein Agl23, partial [Chloroflexia bacterium]
MKTQRQRGTVGRRSSPDPDSNGRSEGANGAGGETAGDQPEATPAQPVAPQLPKRKASRVANSTEPGEDGAKSRQVASAPTAAPSKKSRSTEYPVADALAAGPSGPQSSGAAALPSPRETPAGMIGRAWEFIITYENAIYLAIFVLALVSRFYDLGSRALHHDESLHSVYSRNLYSGAGYQHDPMMHGPQQFHFIALMFWLFGTSDATARFASAICGIIVVMSPFFLRRQMGRLPALIAAILFLVSPGILYFSRMAREDAIFSGMETIMIIGLWRFLSTRRPGDFYIFCVGLSLMFTIKESAYLTVAVLGALFMFLFAYQAGYAILGALLAYLATLGGALLYWHGQIQAGKISALPDIPNTNPDYNTITRFASSFITHPQVLSGIIITVLFIVVLVLLFVMQARRYVPSTSGVRSLVSRKVRSTNGVETPAVAVSEVSANGQGSPAAATVAETPLAGPANGQAATEAVPAPAPAPEIAPLWNPKALAPRRRSFLAHYEQGSLPYMVGGLLARPSVLLIGFLIAATIFVTLYSVFFTDVPRGIASGLFASLGYWIAQQSVARGGQPWFFYFLLVPLYEPIAVFFSAAAAIFFSWRGLRWLRRHKVFFSGSWWRWRLFMDRDDPQQAGRPHLGAFLPLFTGWWLLGALAIYSWAGEKMPWLMMHITRPAIYMASLVLGALAASLIAARKKRILEAELLDGRQRFAGDAQPGRRMAAGAHLSLSWA